MLNHRCLRTFSVLVPLLALTIAGFFSPAARAEDATTDMGPKAFSISVPAGKLTLQDLHSAVTKAPLARGWTVKEDSDAKVVLYLLHHGVEATVTFLISEEEIEAYCVAFAVDKEGNHKKPEQPTNWLGNLKKDITKSLTVAMAPERK